MVEVIMSKPAPVRVKISPPSWFKLVKGSMPSTVKPTSIGAIEVAKGVRPLASDTLTFQLPAAELKFKVQVISVSLAVTSVHSEFAKRTLTSVVGKLVPPIVSESPLRV